MRCLSPILVKAPLSIFDNRRKFLGHRLISVPCGKCFNCLVNKRSQWAFRLTQELENSTSNYFITLTYDNDNIPTTIHDNKVYFTLDKKFMARWLKNMVQYCRKYYDVVLKYYLCGEYGWKNGRPHYHMHLFNFPGDDNALFDFLFKRWSYGNFFIGNTSAGSSMYCTKHNIVKRLPADYNPNFDVEQLAPPFLLVSKGIGKAYKNQLKRIDDNGNIIFSVPTFVNFDGSRIPTPKYYKVKVPNYQYNVDRLDAVMLKSQFKIVDYPDNALHDLAPFLNCHEIDMSQLDVVDYTRKFYWTYVRNFFNVREYTNQKLFNLLEMNQKI